MGGSILSGVDERSGGDPNYQLDVGSVLGRTFGVWAANFVPFCVLGLIVEAPVLVVLVVLAVSGTSLPTLQRVLDGLSALLALVLTGGVTYGVFQALRNARPSLAEVLRLGLSRVLTVFVTALFTGIAVALGCCALIVPGLILMARFWVAVPVSVIEAPGAFGAMSRSAELTEGNRWRVFGLVLIMGLIAGGANAVLGVVSVLVAGAGSEPGVVPAWTQALMGLALIPVQALTAVAPAVAYHDLRVGREGADVEELLKIFE
jgi:hypothetical protein